jgi:hypothetical protein
MSYQRCQKQVDCLDIAARVEIRAPLRDCLRDGACRDGWRECLKKAGQAVSKNPEFVTYRTACEKKRASCKEMSGRLCDEEVAAVNGEWLGRIATCFERGCEEVDACIEALTASVGCR